jgi:hypothetical protein
VEDVRSFKEYDGRSQKEHDVRSLKEDGSRLSKDDRPISKYVVTIRIYPRMNDPQIVARIGKIMSVRRGGSLLATKPECWVMLTFLAVPGVRRLCVRSRDANRDPIAH